MRDLVIITGMSGSGKSVGLGALEDAGYACIDNLPPELLPDVLRLREQGENQPLGVAVDVRHANSLPKLPQILKDIKTSNISFKVIFLDACTETLVRRFSETRRRHPLSIGDYQLGNEGLIDTIQRERGLLESLRDKSLVIDTSNTRSAQLQENLKQILQIPPGKLTLIFQSFAFKRGIPLDADYVFDVRMLPNPYYNPELRAYTGLDQPVIDFFASAEDMQKMDTNIKNFLQNWLPKHAQNHRSYVSVAIGCTGGQHRSVYLVEQLAKYFSASWNTLHRHRELKK